MTIRFPLIDLSQLPTPDVVEALDYETILAAMLADLRVRDQGFSALVESDPAYKLLEIAAYRELLLRQRVNSAARSVMLAFATGADLDQLAGNFGVQRLTITQADETSTPPTPAVSESDDELRARVLMSLDGYTTAGSAGSYVFHAMSASGDCKDVAVTSLTPGQVTVAVLSQTGNGGAAPQKTLDAVRKALSAETVRPLCDEVVVESARVLTYRVTGELTLSPGIGSDKVIAAAEMAVKAYAAEQHRLGRSIARSGLFAALHQAGVQAVLLSEPASDIVTDWNQAAFCTGLSIREKRAGT